MADLNIHKSDCLIMLGEAFKDVHLQLDRFAGSDNPDLSHREKVHNWKGVVEILAQHGTQAAIAAIIHILRDITGVRPWMSDVQKVFVTHEFPIE